MNHGGDFMFDELAHSFSFSSPSSSSTNTSRSRPRLSKLRKPKSSFLQKGPAAAADPLPYYNPFRNQEEGAGGHVFGVMSSDVFKSAAAGDPEQHIHDASTSTDGGKDKAFHECTVPHFSLPTSQSLPPDENVNSPTQLPNAFQKLTFIDTAAPVSAGIPFACANLSCFEFKSGKNQGCHDADTSNTSNGTGHGNMFFQGAAIANSTAFRTSSSTSTSSATNICDQNENNFTRETFANGHLGEGFYLTGKSDAAISPNIKPSCHRKVKLVPKRHSGKQANLKMQREKVNLNMESRVDPASCGKESASKEFCSRPESPQPYSPMDMSPNPVNEAPKTSDETLKQGGTFESSEGTTQDRNHPLDEDLAYVRRQLNIAKNVKGTHIDYARGCAFEGIRKTPREEFASESETESFKSATEDLELNAKNSTSTASSCNSGSDGTSEFITVCNNQDTSGTKFIFTASPSSAKSASVRRFKAINRSKGFDSSRCTATSEVFGAFTGGQHLEETFQDDVNTDLTCSQLKPKLDFTTSIRGEADHKLSGAPEATTIAQEACEKWRLRGNEAYANGDPSTAEGYYTRGVRCIPKSEKSRGGHRSLMLCYSNRAAARMSLGRLREAVKDCKLAVGIDPSFLKAHVRAANCYLALGEVEEALKHFKYCLQSGTGVSPDRKILKEASEGLQKAQKVAEAISRSIESIQQGTLNDAEDALRSADKALAICLYSEKLLEIKAKALFLLQKYRKVIQLCQESLDSAERNSNTTVVNGRCEVPNSASLHGRLYFRLWRCRLMLKSYFFLGKLEEALALLENHESLRRGSETLDSLVPFVAVVRELLQYKAVGNEAFQAGNFERAVEHYTAALALNTDSHYFAAICFCNRAAAYKALGKFTDSIADCNLAIALEKDYLKAISRRASLCESIRDYDQAAKDTEILASLLKKQADGILKKSQEKSINWGIPIDLRQAQLQLSRLKEQAKKGTPLDMYLILDVESSASALDIKKAYRQAALKHHPDKAGQILAKGNSRRSEAWKGIAEDIQRDADRLFKLIGVAHTVLSDPAQRSRYDTEEEIRNMSKKNRETFTSRTHCDEYGYPFRSSRRQTKNYWTSQGYF